MSNEIRLNSSPNNNSTPWADLELGNLFEGNSHLDGRIYKLGVDSLNSSLDAEETNSSFPNIPVRPLNSAEALPGSPSLALPLPSNMSAHLDSTETLSTAGTKRKRCEDTEEIRDKSYNSVQAHINETMDHAVDEPSLPIWRRSVQKPQKLSEYAKCKEEFEKYMNQNPDCNMESVQAHLKETLGRAPTQRSLYRWKAELQEKNPPRERGKIDYNKCKEEAKQYVNQHPDCNIESIQAHLKETVGHAPAERTLYMWKAKNFRKDGGTQSP